MEKILRWQKIRPVKVAWCQECLKGGEKFFQNDSMKLSRIEICFILRVN